jgi:hypothetical protein
VIRIGENHSAGRFERDGSKDNIFQHYEIDFNCSSQENGNMVESGLIEIDATANSLFLAEFDRRLHVPASVITCEFERGPELRRKLIASLESMNRRNAIRRNPIVRAAQNGALMDLRQIINVRPEGGISENSCCWRFHAKTI